MGSVRFFQPLTYTKEASAAMAVASNEFIASTPWPPACRHWWQSTVRLTRLRRNGSGKACVVSTVSANARRRRPLCRFISWSQVCTQSSKHGPGFVRCCTSARKRISDSACRAHTGAACRELAARFLLASVSQTLANRDLRGSQFPGAYGHRRHLQAG